MYEHKICVCFRSMMTKMMKMMKAKNLKKMVKSLQSSPIDVIRQVLIKSFFFSTRKTGYLISSIIWWVG